ncbi:hypothetical protein AAG570_013524 [Ranatra chinensis]|uniref:Matrix-remodeling-associated protein 7 helical domain-containing protein n=1 Tax=Ranatra chinensis TaxID=642074 RepID=A0ABD0YR68_9HEMI
MAKNSANVPSDSRCQGTSEEGGFSFQNLKLEMTSQAPWIENLTIYGDNLSAYYVVCALVSFLAVIFTWWTQRGLATDNKMTDQGDPVSSSSEESLTTQQESPDNNEANLDENIKKLTKAERCALLDEVAQTLSEDQIQQEKEMEKQQLENIFELLKQQQEKFQIESIEELEDQMKFYRA